MPFRPVAVDAAQPVIAAEDVHVHFRRGLIGTSIRALDGLSLKVREGEFFALVGQNGAGKSTAMYSFLGLLRLTSGRVRLMGGAPELGSAVFSGVGYLPEEPHYDLYLTVEEALRYYGSLYRRRISKAEIISVLDRLGMGQFRDLQLSKCSKGMKQKLGIAQCLIHDVRVLFLDEPTRGLDPIVVMTFREILREIHRRGTTVIMNTHVLSEVEMLATRVAILERGRLIAEDSLEHLLRTEQAFYQVAFEPNGSTPEYLLSAERRGETLHGVIPADRLFDFMQFTRNTGARLVECSLKKVSLEESFMKILKGDPAAGPTAPLPTAAAPAEPSKNSSESGA
jgi:ABC-type multidrug transport system ATPase subunit